MQMSSKLYKSTWRVNIVVGKEKERNLQTLCLELEEEDLVNKLKY